MSYVSLYRKFRPTAFDKVVGQQHVIRTLGNQLKSGSVSHAYLFTGSRGTGKTSVAKIFAKAVDCISPLSDGSPCGKCISCAELGGGGNLDILEIDAASNNGVDEIRDLRDNVKYLPSVSKYKVYIIDEVHMLSNSAFNALLKTLEEPPEHVIFILATTEVQKIPPTVLSRCMRFDFRLLTIDELVSLLATVMDGIGKRYEQEALIAIATAGAGSARDTLSLADMCVSYCGEVLDYQSVIEALGLCSPDTVINLTADILRGDTDKALREVNGVYAKGKSVNTLAKDVAAMLSNIGYAHNCTNANTILKLPVDIYEKVRSIAVDIPNARILHALEVFCYLEGELRYSSYPKVVLEMAVIKACEMSSDFSKEGLLKRLKAIEEGGVIAQGKIADIDIDGNKIWQSIIGQVRQDNPSARVLLDSITPKCAVIDGILAVVIDSEEDKMLLSNVLDVIKDAVVSKYAYIKGVRIDVVKSDDSIERQLQIIRNMVGLDKVKIVNGGNNNG